MRDKKRFYHRHYNGFGQVALYIYIYIKRFSIWDAIQIRNKKAIFEPNHCGTL